MIVDAILSVVKSGGQWRRRPNDYPPWQRVCDHFSRWSKGGALDQLNALHRQTKARSASPSTRQASRPSTRAKNVGSTGARKSKGINAISWLRLLATSCLCPCTPPIVAIPWPLVPSWPVRRRNPEPPGVFWRCRLSWDGREVHGQDARARSPHLNQDPALETGNSLNAFARRDLIDLFLSSRSIHPHCEK